MTQEKKRNYRRKPADNLASAATEMGNIPPQALDIEEAVLGAEIIIGNSRKSGIAFFDAFGETDNSC